MKNAGFDGKSPEGGVEKPDKTRGFFSGRKGMIIMGLLGAAGLGILVMILRFAAENREAQERARRRAKRLQRTRDMTGSQQIEMDLKVQGRLRKKQRKRK
jgi:hypothetical protein